MGETPLQRHDQNDGLRADARIRDRGCYGASQSIGVVFEEKAIGNAELGHPTGEDLVAALFGAEHDRVDPFVAEQADGGRGWH